MSANLAHASSLPVAVIGAGPVGLAAAVQLLARGETPIVLEAGDTVGASLHRWGHVRLFSPWRYVMDAPSQALLAQSAWQAPDPERLPTGGQIARDYLEPLAALPQLAPHIRLRTRVTSVARRGFDKLKTEGREHAPFALRVRGADGHEEEVFARAVIDASGTYTAPNPLGANGIPARGEEILASRIAYGIPDALGADRARYAGKRVLVVGSGHSAFNTLLDLAQLAAGAPGTRITWVVRAPVAKASTLFGSGEDDALPARGALGQGVRRLVQKGHVRLVSLRIAAVDETSGGIVVRGETPDGDEVALAPVDEIVACTGFRPDLSMLRELRLDLDPIVESPSALAPLVDPNVHGCGTVPPHGAVELRHPEADFYVVGMKSYGRAPTFLLLTGYEQVRSVAAAIAGDWDAARSVELVLPETGVCSSSGDCDGDGDDEIDLAQIQVEAGAGTEAALTLTAPLSAPLRSRRLTSTSVCCGQLNVAVATRRAATAAPPRDVASATASFMRLLADPTRRRIFLRLMEGELCNCEMVSALDLPQSLISHHLRQLHAAGIVTARRDDDDHRWIYYAIDAETLAAVHQDLTITFDPAAVGTAGPCAGS